MISLALLAVAWGMALSESHSVTLRWTPSVSPDVVGYNIYRKRTIGRPRSLNLRGHILASQCTPDECRAIDTTVKAGFVYWYAVKAVDSIGRESMYSNLASAAVR